MKSGLQKAVRERLGKGTKDKESDMHRQVMVAQIEREIEAQLPSLKVWQQRGLSLWVWGLLALSQAQLSKIAEAGRYSALALGNSAAPARY